MARRRQVLNRQAAMNQGAGPALPDARVIGAAVQQEFSDARGLGAGHGLGGPTREFACQSAHARRPSVRRIYGQSKALIRCANC